MFLPNSVGATPGRVRSNDLAGSKPPWLRPAYCFASVIMWTENKNVTISDCFICFILIVKQSAALAAARVLRATTKKGHQLFWGKKRIRWPGLRIFWPRNDLAPLLRWRLGLNLMTCLTTLVTWKWPGCLDILAPPLLPNIIWIGLQFGSSSQKKVNFFWDIVYTDDNHHHHHHHQLLPHV